MPESARPSISESLYRLIEKQPFGGLTSSELARLSGETVHTVCSLLPKMSKRGIVARDPQTRCWVITVPNAWFKGAARPKPAPPPPPPPLVVLRPVKGVTHEDLEWMRRQRANAEARRQRQGVARG
jgi:hypothetical protein